MAGMECAGMPGDCSPPAAASTAISIEMPDSEAFPSASRRGKAAGRMRNNSAVMLLLAAGGGVLLYLAAYTLKRHVFASDIALTEGGHLLLAFLPVFAGAAYLLWRKKILGADGCIAAFLIAVLAISVFNLIVPSVFDRSVSLYLLNTLDNAPAGLDEAQLREEFVSVYFGANYGIRKRLREQMRMGNIAHDGARYRLTDAGRRMVAVVRFFNALYALDPHMAARNAPPPAAEESHGARE